MYEIKSQDDVLIYSLTLDDLIGYLGHTLEQHKGCDIIDLYPGVGLWSQKIHNFLKPRSHILLEPSENFDRYLEPLVNAPGSTYQLFRDDPTMLNTYTDLFKRGVFPHQKPVDTQSARTGEINTSLLVIGSLAWHPRLPGFSFTSMMRQVLIKLAEQTWSNGYIHSSGPVRSLIWGTQDEMTGFLPKGMGQVSRYSHLLTRYTDVREWATTSGQRVSERRPQYDMESTVRVMRKAKQLGLELPKHRRDTIHEFADEIADLTGGTGKMMSAEFRQYLMEKEMAGISTSGLSAPADITFWQAEKAYLEMRAANEEKFKGKMKHLRSPPDAKLHSQVRASRKRLGVVHARVEAIAIMGEEIYDLECKILALPDGPEKDQTLAALEEKEEEFETAVEETNVNFRSAIFTEIDDRLALRSPVTLLNWEKRAFEPLTVQPDEVWPVMGASLMDIMPRPLPSEERRMALEWANDFAYGLMESQTMSIHDAMNGIQSGASDLLDQVPIMKDPKRGGRLNMRNFRVRMLTHEMLEELAKAYKEWPFKHPEANYVNYFRLRVAKTREKVPHPRSVR